LRFETLPSERTAALRVSAAMDILSSGNEDEPALREQAKSDAAGGQKDMAAYSCP
jgi:hypothetical protein